MSLLVDQMRKVSYGLGLIYISIAITIPIFIIAIVVGVSMGEKIRAEGMEALGPIGYVVTFLSLLSGVVGVVGRFYCVHPPERSQAGGPIFASLLFSSFGLITQVGAQIPATAELFEGGANLAPLLTVMGFVTLMIFLRRMSEYAGEPFLAHRARIVLLGTMIIVPLYLIGLVSILSGEAGVLAPVVALGLLVLTVAGIILFIRYANLLRNLRTAIDLKVENAGDFDDLDEF